MTFLKNAYIIKTHLFIVSHRYSSILSKYNFHHDKSEIKTNGIHVHCKQPIICNISIMYMNEMHILKNQTCRISILSIEEIFWKYQLHLLFSHCWQV